MVCNGTGEVNILVLLCGTSVFASSSYSVGSKPALDVAVDVVRASKVLDASVDGLRSFSSMVQKDFTLISTR
jgi:hypothetical protein